MERDGGEHQGTQARAAGRAGGIGRVASRRVGSPGMGVLMPVVVMI